MKLTEVEEKLLKIKDCWIELTQLVFFICCCICLKLDRSHTQAYGVLSYEKVEEMMQLMLEPLVSMCTLRWIHMCVLDSNLNSKEEFLILLPIFFQLITSSASYHSYQRLQCFAVLKVSTASCVNGVPSH
jgi:hypothetical protein